MNRNNRHLIIKVLVIGIMIASLAYLFHPAVGEFGVIVNGEPVAEPWAGLAAIPTMLLVLALSVVLVFLLFVGVGLFFFIGALLFSFLGIMLVAPYFWPILLIILLVIALMSVGSGDKR